MCNKTPFNNPSDALKRIQEISQIKNKHKKDKPIRYYRCPNCKKYHITHKSLNEANFKKLSFSPPENIQELYEERLKHYGLKS